MTLLLALLRQAQPSLLLQQHATRRLAVVVAGQVAIPGNIQQGLCTSSSPGNPAAPRAGWQQQLLQQQQQQPWEQRHATSRGLLLDVKLPWPGQWNSCRTFLNAFSQPNSKAYKERRLIGYSPEQLYEVIAQVQHYHQFVPWCVGSNVLHRSPDDTYLEAELKIGFQMISERYTSLVKLQAPQLVTSTVANSGLFHHLESTWRLQPGPNPHSTWLSFSVDFAFLNPLYANIAQLFFSEVVTCMMGAFEGRCRHLYGPPCFSPAGQRHSVQQPHQQQQQHSRHLQHHHHIGQLHGQQQQQQQHAGAAGDQPALLQQAPAGAAAAAAVTPTSGAAGKQQGEDQQRWRSGEKQ